MSTEVLLNEFKEYSEHPYRVLSEYKKQGKKVIGMLPYYAPAELVVAAGMVPMGIWGSNKKTIALAKEYCATFYCTIAQLALEMLLDGTLDQLDGVITPTICDTLRPMSQNIRVAMSDKLPCIFLAHPQYRKPAFGLQFTVDQYMHVKSELAAPPAGLSSSWPASTVMSSPPSAAPPCCAPLGSWSPPSTPRSWRP